MLLAAAIKVQPCLQCTHGCSWNLPCIWQSNYCLWLTRLAWAFCIPWFCRVAHPAPWDSSALLCMLLHLQPQQAWHSRLGRWLLIVTA